MHIKSRWVSWPLFLASFLILPLFAAPAAAGGDADWKVGLAKVNITPQQPVMLGGYGVRTTPFEKVATDIFVKAMVLQDQGGNVGVVVTSDLLGFSAAVAEPICQRIEQQTGLKRDQILINSSHIHTGPLVNLNMPAKDAPGAAEAFRTVEFTRQLQDKVVQCVVQAKSSLKPAKISTGSGVVNFVMNRREFTPKGIILGNNPRGLADRSVPVLRVDGADGKPLAILFGAATHNTTLGPDFNQVCGDYAGYAQNLIEERYPGAQAMFAIGCAGDSNPYPRGTLEISKGHGKALGEEICRVVEGKLKPVRGPLKIAFGKVDLPLEPVPSREELQKIAANKQNAKNLGAADLLKILDKGEKPPTQYTCPVTVWQFGSDLTLIGLPGEVVVDYVPLIEKALGPNQLWIAAYCNDVFGYFPSARVSREGGYETRGLYAGGAGFFAPQSEEALVQKVRELAIQAGRKIP